MLKLFCATKLSFTSVTFVALLLSINLLDCVSFQSTTIPSLSGREFMFSFATTFRRKRETVKFVTSLLESVKRDLLLGSSSTSLGVSSSSSKEGDKSQFKSNEYLVQTRLAVAAAKRESRQKTLDQDRERNLRLKRLIHTNSSAQKDTTESGFPIPKLYAVRVSADQILRDELRMNGREKRGRVFIEIGSDGATTFKGLKFELHSFFRSLKKSTYLVSAGLPKISISDGSILSPGENEDIYNDFIPIESDEDVVELFLKAEQFFETHNAKLDSDAPNVMQRPSIVIHVRKDPNAPKPPPPPSYLKDIANPNETNHMTMLSFYSFPPDGGVKDPEDFALFLRKVWKPFDPLGRVYIAQEGINAQMAVPTNVLDNFIECCMQIPELGVHMENGINIDPIPLTVEEFTIAGDLDGKPAPPFKTLHVRVRSQVVADGLDDPLDWDKAGYDMPPLEWHNKIKAARKKRNSGADKKDIPLILDCRNDYETSVGRFEGAEPLNTETFRDSWDVLKEKLKDTPRDASVMTYCTGGIRCVKVGAYLTQELGFTNVSRLAGGIISYDRTVSETIPEEEKMFKGTNYVFDGRVGRQITDDALGECITCGAKTNLISNCNNDRCHKRMVQCEKCKDIYLGTCSEACKTRVINSGTTTREQGTTELVKYNDLNEYSLGHSTSPSSFYREIELNTAKYLGSGLHMLSDTTQGRILTNLVAMSREGRVLEIGTFTGYSTACFLEGAASAAEVIGKKEVGSREGGAGYVLSLERDLRAVNIASHHLGIMCEFGLGEEAAIKASEIRQEGSAVPDVEGDHISFNFKQAGCEIIHVTDALAFVEAMAKGVQYSSTSPFDIVFIDGDKTRFLDYVEACLSCEKVLKKGGLMVIDNVLWKGLVLEAASGDWSGTSEEDLTEPELKKSRRARKLANTIHNFNNAIVHDERVEVVMLPMRDGLSIIRKK